MNIFDSSLQNLATEIVLGKRLSTSELLALAEDNDNTNDLIFCAGKIRQAMKGSDIQLCAIVNARSGKCSENCSFCSQSAHYDTDVDVYPLRDTETLLDVSKDKGSETARHFGIVTSGKSISGDSDLRNVCDAIEKIKSEGHVLPCASLGTLTEETAKQLKNAGLKRYHHNLETSEGFFPNVCTTHTYAERVKTLETVKGAGMELCSGGIFGLGEEWKDRVELAVALRDLGVTAVPLNFLVAIAGTPLAGQEPLPPMEILKIIALFRFALPEQDIKVCGGRTTNLKDLQSWIFLAGANGMMIGNYLTTAGRSADVDLAMLRDLGVNPVF